MAADPLTAVAAVATVANVASSISRANAESDAADASAQQARIQTEAQTDALERRRDLALGAGRARIGGSGLLLDGAPEDALDAQAAAADQEIETARSIGGLRVDAAASRADAAGTQAGATLLGGVSRFGLLAGGGGGL